MDKDSRIDGMTANECAEFSYRYFVAARALRRKYGRRAAYRREWLDGAWQFRVASRLKRNQGYLTQDAE